MVEARTGRWSQAGFPGHRVLEIPLAATLRLPSKRSNQLAHIGTYALPGMPSGTAHIAGYALARGAQSGIFLSRSRGSDGFT